MAYPFSTHSRELVRESAVSSCGWLETKLKIRNAANVSRTLRRTERKSLLRKLSRTLAEYVGKKQAE
jgi:hypothetical protein